MAKNCCKYFTVSLVPVASLTLAVVFGLGIVVLPILYVHLADHMKVSVREGGGGGMEREIKGVYRKKEAFFLGPKFCTVEGASSFATSIVQWIYQLCT